VPKAARHVSSAKNGVFEHPIQARCVHQLGETAQSKRVELSEPPFRRYFSGLIFAHKDALGGNTPWIIQLSHRWHCSCVWRSALPHTAEARGREAGPHWYSVRAQAVKHYSSLASHRPPRDQRISTTNRHRQRLFPVSHLWATMPEVDETQDPVVRELQARVGRGEVIRGTAL
jgi:hypothetical protein